MSKSSFKTKIVLLIILLMQNSYLYAETSFNNITILVSSCDKYAPLWGPFFTSLFKQWPSLLSTNKHVPIILIANSKSFPNTRVETINIPNERSWSDNMLIALAKVQTKYVMVILDDYWINAPVNEDRLQEVFNTMQAEKIVMVQLAYQDSRYQFGNKHPTLADAVYTNKFAHYKASLQLGIWDIEALKTLLRPGEDPWAFELAGTARSHGYPGNFLNLTKNFPITYINASQQGHIEPAAIDYALQNGITFDRGNLPIKNKFNYKITYNTWKKRAQKLWDFLQEPGLFYKSGNQVV